MVRPQTYGKLRALKIKQGKKVIFDAQKRFRKAITQKANRERTVTTQKAQAARKEVVDYGEQLRDKLEEMLKPVHRNQREAFMRKFTNWQ